MLFNSFVFILVFLPVTFASFWVTRGPQNKIALLFFASLFFYGWWNPVYLPLLMGSVVINHVAAHLIGKNRSKMILWTGISVNLLLLGFFKYYQLLSDTIRYLSGLETIAHGIILPLAISFYTFQQISYLVDCYYNRIKPSGLLNYCAYVTFFPQLIAGPVVKYADFSPQLAKVGKFCTHSFVQGLFMFFMGLAKKVVFADSIGSMGHAVFENVKSGNTVSFAEAWWGSSTYALQMYYDFSAYSDMAIGLGLLFGIALPLNFRSPYQATSITQFWSRWHITLTSFFTQYLHLPISMKFGVRTIWGHSLVTLLVMSLVGFWHGAGWNFVIWGGIHGLYLIGARFISKRSQPEGKSVPSFHSKLFGRLRVFALVSLTYPFFKLEKFSDATAMFMSQFRFADIFSVGALPKVSAHQVAFFVLLILTLWYAPNLTQMAGLCRDGIKERALPTINEFSGIVSGVIVGAVAAIGLIWIAVVQESEFLYFQF